MAPRGKRRWVRILTGPWVTLALLLAGLALGTWAPDLAGPFQTLVEWLLAGLAVAIPVIILTTILPALLSLFDTSGGKGPAVVLTLFAVTTIVAGIYALMLAWLVFQLPIGGGDGGTGFGAAFANLTGGDLLSSAPVFAVVWAFGAAIALHFVRLAGRKVETTGSLPRRAFGGLVYFVNETIRIFAWIGDKGVGYVGKFFEYALPLLLFSVGAFVPESVRRATELAGNANADFNALAWYLGTAALVAIVTISYLLFVGLVATRYSGTSFKRALRVYLPPVYSFAWATSSSTLTIPVNLEAASRGLDVDRSTREFVIPLGATVNLDGSMIAAVFLTPVVAIAIGFELSLGQLAATLLPLLVLTIGAPGLPAGLSFIAPPIIAAVLGLTGDLADAFIGVWFAFSLGLTDQFRTAVNSSNNGFLCLIVERMLGGPRMEVWLEEIDGPRGGVRDGPVEASA